MRYSKEALSIELPIKRRPSWAAARRRAQQQVQLQVTQPPTLFNDLSGLRQGGARNSEDGFDLSDAAGVIPRAIHQIFTTLDAHGAEYTVKCSFLELYQARPAVERPTWAERACHESACQMHQHCSRGPRGQRCPTRTLQRPLASRAAVAPAPLWCMPASWCWLPQP